jgi:hypothetical protein
MSQPTTLETLLDDITVPTIGMPVRLMERVLEVDREAAPAVCEVLESRREEGDHDLLWLVVMLGELGEPAAVPSLVALLGLTGEIELPGAAAEALAKIGEPAVPFLVETLRQGSPQERIWAYGTLGWIGGEPAYTALLEALERDRELADVIATALAALGRAEAIPAIYGALERSEEWQRIDLNDAIVTLGRGHDDESGIGKDWRLRYRRQPRLGSFMPAWPAIPATVHGNAELRKARKGVPVRPLEEILSEPPEPEPEPETCENCGAPIEYPTNLPVCPETALSAVIRQIQLLNDARERGLEDLFDVWEDVEASIVLLMQDEEEHPEQRERWMDERDEAAIDWQTCEWLVTEGLETVGAAKARLTAEAARLADRFGDPDGLLSPVRPARAGAIPRTQPSSPSTEPAAREAHVGRNAPCPCGSGKKYKRCCGAPATATGPGSVAKAGREPKKSDARTPSPTAERRTNDRLWPKLLKFARRPEVAIEISRALARWEDEDAAVSCRSADALPVPEWAQPPFWEWLLLDFRLEGGETLLQRYLARRPGLVEAKERTVLEKLGASRLSLYEVLDVQRDEGLTLRDLFGGGTVDVRERSGTHQLVRWDLLAARLIELDAAMMLSGGIFVFPARDRAELIEGLEEEYARVQEQRRDITRDEFLKESAGEWFYGRALAQLGAPLPRLVTAEGDELLACRAHYRVKDRAAVLAALREEAALDEYEDEPGSFGWYEPLEGEVHRLPENADWDDAKGAGESLTFDSAYGVSRRGLGHVEVRGERLILECMSRERLERGKALLERSAGRWIAYRGESVQDPWQAAEQERPRKRKPEDFLPPDVERELVQDYMDRHYREWPDEPLPALDGLTPREAARTPKGRRQVADVLRTIENSQARERLESGSAYDVSWLWEELGLKPTE